MAGSANATDDRETLKKIAIAMVWIPFQITMSLIFATGGLFVLALLAFALAPFVGLFFLIRWLARSARAASRPRSRHGPEERPGPQRDGAVGGRGGGRRGGDRE